MFGPEVSQKRSKSKKKYAFPFIFEDDRRTALRAVTAATWPHCFGVTSFAEVKEQAPGEVIAEQLGRKL